MQEFHISIHSFRDVQEFVSLATVQPFPVLVGNDAQHVNGKSFIGMVSLDYSRPLQVCIQCSPEEYRSFRQSTAKFLV